MTNPLTIGAIGAAVLALAIVAVIVVLRRRKKNRPLNTEKFATQWQMVQSKLKDAALWPLAIIDADKLLDEALKQKRYKGKTMGERLVAAQRDIPNNDKVWFAHKLRNKLVHEQDIKVSKNMARDALLAVREALRSLGALEKKK